MPDVQRKHYRYLLIAENYWARGETQKEAFDKLKKEGFRKKSGYFVIVVPRWQLDIRVDGDGSICYYRDESIPYEYCESQTRVYVGMV